MTWFRLPRAWRRGVFLLSAVMAGGIASCIGDDPGPESNSISRTEKKQALSGGAANSGLFELDRNAEEGATAGDDWSTLFAGSGSAIAVVSPMPIPDKGLGSGTALLDHIFKSSSDVNDISTWNWVVADANKPGALPPKDNTTNAYAAAYLGNGEMFLYFGQDRFTANGTSDIGFWFLKNEIALVPAGCSLDTVGCTGSFSGTHAVGDVLVLSAFTNGGQVDTIEVYEWVGSGGNAGGGALQLKYSGTNADCSTPAGSSAPACAIVNLEDETSPWTYLAGETGSVPGIFPRRHFFEGGVNLTSLGLQGCFTSFLSETRSSSSLTAQLKDFALGAFAVCDIDVTKDGPSLSKVGDTAEYSYTITNPGAVPLELRSVIDDPIGNLESYATAAGCGVLAPGASCSFQVSFVIPAGASDPFVNTVTVKYAESAVATRTFSASASHSLNLFQPSIELAKDGDTLSKIGDVVQYRITLSNTSSADAPDLVCTISDPKLGVSKSVTLSSGTSSVIDASYTVQSGDPDPLENTATATCSPTGFPNVLTDSATHSVNLFQPSIALTKSGDTLSKVGDVVQYQITLSNTSSADTPDLNCTVADPLLGLSTPVTLSSGTSRVINGSYTVQNGDPDPLVNTVTGTCSPTGFPNVLTTSATHSVNLFQPSIELAKSGDTLSKVGDVVEYQITLSNTSSADSPDLQCTISDPKLGISQSVTLSSGASSVVNASYTVQSGDPDPLVNTATATCSPTGFPNVLTTSASHSVNLFQPSITLTKSGPAFSKAGDTASYVITLTNTSSADTPNLSCSISDPTAGVEKIGVILAAGASDVTSAARTVQPTDPDPLVNTATATCSPMGFPNVLQQTASSIADLLHPSWTVREVCTTDPVPSGSPAQFSLVLANTGDADLVFVISGSSVSSFNGTFPVASGQNLTLSGSVAVPGGVVSVSNTASASITLDPKYGLPNQYTDSASATCQVRNFQGCTPGGWKNPNGRLQLWNSPTDPLAVAAGFSTGTPFHTYFGLSPNVTGLSSSLTMEGAINLGGGGAGKLARHGVAALLNIAAGLNYLFPPGTNSAASLISAIQNAYNTASYEPLASQLDNGNNQGCPVR